MELSSRCRTYDENFNSVEDVRYVVARPSVCLSSVTFVHPTQAIEIFGNVSMAFCTLAIC